MEMGNKEDFEGRKGDEEEEEEAPKTILGTFTREQFVMLCVGTGLVVLLLIITVTSVVVTMNSASPDSLIPFPTDGDMLDFLIQNGEIHEKDALLATWYHSANNKSEMNKALQGASMVLEADVNVQGHNTVNQTNIPIMAHPPDIYSDNTLEEWLDMVLKSKKGIKLDFKSIDAVEPSLDILRAKNQTGINRPVWLNADILPGPNVPGFWPVINGNRFFELIQQKFPDVTISPGWAVLYLPMFPNVTYTRGMVEEMYDLVRNIPQKVTFPVLAVMAKSGWPHLSWLLSQSPRFSLTMWQGKENPSVSDLLFIRDNSHPQRIYYDIYEPGLSQFKEAALKKGRQRRFYPGGDITEYFKPANNDGMHIRWEIVTDRGSLMSWLRDSGSGILVFPVQSGRENPDTPVVVGSHPELSLQECLDFILTSKKPGGIYLRVSSPSQLVASLNLLRTYYDSDLLHHPTWLNMDISHGPFHVPGYITGQEFLSIVNQIFPYVTLAPGWPREALSNGYTVPLVDAMVQLFQDEWQDISLQMLAEPLQKSDTRVERLLQTQQRVSVTVESGPKTDDNPEILNSSQKDNTRRTFSYIQPNHMFKFSVATH